jgi:hypothetical protein
MADWAAVVAAVVAAVARMERSAIRGSSGTVSGISLEAIIDIKTLAITRGAISIQARSAVLQWISVNRAAIVREWNRLNPRFPVR